MIAVRSIAYNVRRLCAVRELFIQMLNRITMDRLKLLKTIGDFKQGRIIDEVVITAVDEYSEALIAAKPIVMRSLPEDYWKRRCALAEQCLETSTCDPDITAEQCAAWAAYHSFIKEFGNNA